MRAACLTAILHNNPAFFNTPQFHLKQIIMLTLKTLFNKKHIQLRLLRAFCEAKKGPTFEELLDQNTSQSLKEAAKQLANLEAQEKAQAKTIEELTGKISQYTRISDDLAKKLQALKQTLRNQEEELGLVKKRTEKQIENAKDYSITKFAKQVIQVSDNLKKCAELTQKTYGDHPDQFAKELLACKNLLFDTLGKYDIHEFDPIGEKYNPNTQQSMVEVPDPTKPSGTVAMTSVTGYTMKGRLLRSAKVCVYRS